MNASNSANIILTIAIGVAAIIIVWFAFKHWSKNSDKIHRRFLGKLVYIAVILICLASIVGQIDPTLNLHSTLLKGSALIVAIVGFAAQTAISDLICGFLISIHKPFEIGDRVIPEGLEPGIVEDITLRHTVLRIYDGLRVIVPNSEMNSKVIVNTGWKTDRRGVHLTFSVSYDTDIQMAMDVIRDCVAESPYTLGIETNGIKEDSGPVYFLKFADSALILETTIWVTRDTSTYVATTDVNMRVNRAFKEHGIEIPYNFINVVERENTTSDGNTGIKKKTSPRKRTVRTDTVNIVPGSGHIELALETVRGFAMRQRLSERATMQLELMTEETIGIIGNIVDKATAKLWVEGSGVKYRIHISFASSFGTEVYKRLISLSSSGKNEAVKSFAGKIWEKMLAGIKTASEDGPDSGYEWSLRESGQEEDGYGESILTSLADDVKVSVTKEKVELIVVKSVQQ
ncbi:MAG: mechanosensitive ion channel family protein [Lachnospiraceae bacterium]|nr:mechanosensitive ion channel family protein [Lachnospiraceae bacterium]